MAQHKGLGFEAGAAPNAPERIETDSQRLGQILKNLLSNALKFTETGVVSLRVSVGSGDTVRSTFKTQVLESPSTSGRSFSMPSARRMAARIASTVERDWA